MINTPSTTVNKVISLPLKSGSFSFSVGALAPTYTGSNNSGDHAFRGQATITVYYPDGTFEIFTETIGTVSHEATTVPNGIISKVDLHDISAYFGESGSSTTPTQCNITFDVDRYGDLQVNYTFNGEAAETICIGEGQSGSSDRPTRKTTITVDCDTAVRMYHLGGESLYFNTDIDMTNAFYFDGGQGCTFTAPLEPGDYSFIFDHS